MGKRKILVIGIGLIGGSLAKNLAKSNENFIIGYDTNKKSLEYALLNGIINKSTSSIKETAKEVDYIILGTPISETIVIMKQLDKIDLNHNVIITDVSSVKDPIMKTAQSLTNPRITFIGGHPMAGSHKRGIIAAKDYLFENAIFVLTPLSNCESKHIELLQQLLENTKSHFVILHPNEHDEMTSVISHFPHLIASSLVHQARKWEHTHTYIPKLAAGGFRDITRIASSNPEMWQDIFYHNRSKMSQLLADWIAEMSELKHLLDHNDKNRITSYLRQAKEYRDGLGKKEKGAIPAFHDLYVDVRDQSGAVATLAQLLAKEDLSFNNIEILEIRDGITGVLRLSFPTKDMQLKSYTLLGKHGYEMMIDE